MQGAKRGEQWATFNPRFEEYNFLNEIKIRPGTVGHRDARALLTAAVIAISTIVGSLAVARVSLATKSIASAEAERVMQTEANAREAENERNIHNFMSLNKGTIKVAKQLFGARSRK